MIPALLQQVDRVDTPSVAWSDVVPLIILIGGALVLLLIGSLVGAKLPKGTYAIVSALTGVAALVYSFFLWDDVRDDGARTIISGALGVDGFSVFFMIVICSAAVLASLLADDYLRRERLDGCETYVLLLTSATGGIVMAMANDLIVLFLGLEVLSIALYVLAATHLRRGESQEAAIKYFVLGGFSSAFFLYGVALTYGATGSTNLVRISDFLAANILTDNALLLAGLALMLVGFGFKVSAVPFHFWTPDVYQGSPTPVTAYMASASKAAAFAGLLRVFYLAFATERTDWRPLLWVLAVLTLVVGSVLAVVQTDVKRMLAYSSIAHAGYILVGVQAATAEGTAASLFYLLAYTFMVIGTFGVLTIAGRRGDARHSLDDYKGLAKRRPLLAFALTIFLIAQAGVPLTSGFLAKFEIISAAVDADSYALAIIAMLAAVVAAFLYLRIIVAMYLEEPASDAPAIRIPPAGGIAVGVALAFTLVVGFVPGEVLDFARDAVPKLVTFR